MSVPLPSNPIDPSRGDSQPAADRAEACGQQKHLAAQCNQLVHSEPFRWFVTTHLGPMFKQLQEAALDIETSMERRDRAAVRLKLLEEILKWPEETRDKALVEAAKLEA